MSGQKVDLSGYCIAVYRFVHDVSDSLDLKICIL